MRNRTSWILMGMALVGAGCDDLGTGPERGAEATFTLAVPSSGSGFLGARIPVSDARGRTLDLQSVQLLLRSAELKLQSDDGCAEEDDACEKFVTRAVLVDLPVGGGVITPFSAAIRPGVYDELEVRIKEPEDDNGDRARFHAEHPEWPRKATIRARGTFDSGDGAGPRAFDVFVAVDAEIERHLAPPLVVDASTDPGSVNVTLRVDVADWFRSRGGLIDPSRLAGDDDLMDLVEENIEESLEAFEDADRDGRDEDDDADDDDAAEVEGRVASVSTSAGTYTLTDGRVVRLTASTRIDADGDLTSLAAVASAVAAGEAVEAEAKGVLVTEAGVRVLVATSVKFET